MSLTAAASRASPTPTGGVLPPLAAAPSILGIEWDAENRLLAVKQAGNTLASFTYDGTGRRATKTAGGVTATFVYDSAQFLEERPSTGSTKRYVYGPGIDQPLAQVTGGATSYVVADHLGSAVRTTDSLGNPTVTRQYDPWGNPIQGATTSGYAFTGREWDAESGIYYYRSRYYSALTGSFLSEDAGRAPNLYRYVLGNPVKWVDPWGLDVYVRTDSTGGGGFGHASIIIPDSTSPTRFSEYSYQPLYGGGGAVVQMLQTLLSPAELTKSNPASTAGTQAVCASPDAERMALSEAERIRRNPGRYNPFTNNCAGMARNILLKANPHPQGPLIGIDTPLLLREDVQGCKDAGFC